MLKSKLQRARITHIALEYEGSCAIDSTLLDRAGILEYEQVDVYNLNNGERFTTYAIAAEAGSGIVSLLGAAAHKAVVGDHVIVCSYAKLDERAARQHKPTLIYLDDNNKITHTENEITLPPLRMA